MRRIAVEPTLDELRADARYWRERCDLYRAKTYGLRPTTPSRLRELERAAAAAEARLRRLQDAKHPAGAAD